MKKTSKALLLMLCAVLLVAASVLGTMAYLTSQDSVTNTFTVGKVAITLDEAKVNPDGTPVTGANRVDTNTYHLLPGHSYTKDPTVHVADGSENCWLFVKLENGLKNIIDATTIEDQMRTNGWTLIDSKNNVYAYKDVCSKNINVPVFGSFKLTGTADVANYANASIVVTAYAVQADGFDTATAAWNAAGFTA